PDRRKAAHAAARTPAVHPFPTRRSSDLSGPLALRSSCPALPENACSSVQRICAGRVGVSTGCPGAEGQNPMANRRRSAARSCKRSEEHTSELQSPYDLVCRLLLEKKKNT